MERYLRLNCLFFFFTSRMGHKRAIWVFMISVTNTFKQKIMSSYIFYSSHSTAIRSLSVWRFRLSKNKYSADSPVLPALGLNPAQIIKIVSLINPPSRPPILSLAQNLRGLTDFSIFIYWPRLSRFLTPAARSSQKHAAFWRMVWEFVRSSANTQQKKKSKRDWLTASCYTVDTVAVPYAVAPVGW